MNGYSGHRLIDVRNLSKLLSELPPDGRTQVARGLRESPSPDLARTNFLRLVEASGMKTVRQLPPEDLPALTRLLGGSAYLADFLNRQGERWPEIFSRQVRTERKSQSEHLAELLAGVNDGASREEFARLLRLHKQREMLRIGARDLAPERSVEETMRELTTLAEAALEASYRFGRLKAERDFGLLSLPGREESNGFVVLGMGKLGGEELNLSSDVDLIYLYEDDEGESAGGRTGKRGAREFFSAVAETITALMGEVTEEGFVFRIDLRLRPLGRHGPIVQSVDSALLYYESWGQCWERSALIKARPVAGALRLGSRFLKDVEPFVYRRYLDFSTVEELREMKARIETELLEPEVRRRNVKLGHGGIREIEFFTQALQLVNGGYEPGIRECNTLRALPLLERYGFIPGEESAPLAGAYHFLRDVEHKIQIVNEGHVHAIPKEPEQERSLARRLGYKKKGREDERSLFRRDYRRHTKEVRRAFERLFYSARKEITREERSTPAEAWHDLDQEELVLEELNKLGFAEPKRAYENLLAVRDGTPYSPPSQRRLKVMRALGPALISEIVKSGAPDTALFNLAEFSHRIGGRTGFLTLLAENPKTMRLLINLFASSQFLSDVILKRPELIDSLIRVDLTRIGKSRQRMMQELFASLKEAADLEEELDRMRRYRVEEFIRVGLHDLGGELELLELTSQLSHLAEACLEAAWFLSARETALEWGELEGGRFAILGMGKLGGREIDYNSDLDLIFVYEAPEDARSRGGKSAGIAAHDYYVRLGQKLVTFLSAPTEEGIAYKVDLRLRPSGRSGPLVVSLDAFRNYHQTSSELWERQALIKLRAVAGDRSLGRAAEKIAETFAYARSLAPDEIAQIDHLRMRMERELAQEDDSRFNVKKGKGGMVDIEFLTQMRQLIHGRRRRGIRRRGTLEALDALSAHGIITRRDHRMLADGYLFLRRLDHRLRLERSQSVDVLEREPEKLAGVARALGFKRKGGQDPGAQLLQEYERRREAVRACYERFFKTESGVPEAKFAK